MNNFVFSQERIGENGISFTIYKLRTMVHGACHAMPETMKQNRDRDPHDPRILPSRKWIRKSGIDELPQIVNILKGEMAICGPRPLIPSEFAILSEGQRQARTAVKPGLTGGYGFYKRGTRERSLRRYEDIYLYLRERKEREGKSTVAFQLWFVLQSIKALLQGANK